MTMQGVYKIFHTSAFRISGKKTNPHLVRDMVVTYLRSEPPGLPIGYATFSTHPSNTHHSVKKLNFQRRALISLSRLGNNIKSASMSERSGTSILVRLVVLQPGNLFFCSACIPCAVSFLPSVRTHHHMQMGCSSGRYADSRTAGRPCGKASLCLPHTKTAHEQDLATARIKSVACRGSGASERELEALAIYMGHSLEMQRGSYDR